MNKAFTLIELLIVVAIIAILAAIAVPNFLEAQTRAKVSRVKADLRTLTTGLESYAADHNKYPNSNSYYFCGARETPDEISNAAINEQRKVLERLSTPIAYLANSFLPDPFKPNQKRSNIRLNNPQGQRTQTAEVNNNNPSRGFLLREQIKYAAFRLNPTAGNGQALVTLADANAKSYIIFAGGPNRFYPGIDNLAETNNDPPAEKAKAVNMQFYDPTNGTVSYGYFFRSGGSPLYRGDYGGELFHQIAASR